MKNSLLCIGLLCFTASLCAQAPASTPVTCSFANHPQTDADKAFIAGHYAEAEGLYTAQLSATPSEAAWIGLVHTQIEQNKVNEAVANGERAVAAMPKSAAMIALLGDAQLRAGHLDEASAAFNEARAKDSCLAAAHFGIARLLELSAMHASSLKELAFAHRLAPTDEAISEALFAVLPPGMHAKGLRNLLASDHDLLPEHRSRLEEQAALMEAGAICHVSEPPAVTKIDLTPIFYDGTNLRDYAVRATFGPNLNLNLDLDSTVSGIVLSETDAKKLTVTPAVAGHTMAPYLGSVSSVQIGHLHYENCPISVVTDASLAHRYSVIGTDFFRDSLIHLDWNAKTLTLTRYADAPPANGMPMDAQVPPSEKDWSRVFIDGHRILAPTLVEKKPVGLIMLDTSYTLNMLSPNAAAQFHPTPDSTLSIFGVSGKIVRIFDKEGGSDVARTEMYDLNGKNLPVREVGAFMSVRFAANEAPPFGLWTFDDALVSHDAGIEIGGIVGFSTMRRFYIDFDYRNALVNLKYDVNFVVRQSTLQSQ